MAITTTLSNMGFLVAGVGNDITFSNHALSLDPANFVLNPSLPKSLTASVVATTATTTTVCVFVQGPPLNNDPIPDGLLYTCTFGILPGTSPGSYPLTNSNLIAEDPNAAPLAYVAGADGAVNVALVLPTATPTPLGAKIQLSNNIGRPAEPWASRPTSTPRATSSPARKRHHIQPQRPEPRPGELRRQSGTDKDSRRQRGRDHGHDDDRRVFVQGPPINNAPIPDGPLYSCAFNILPGTLPGSYPLLNSNAVAQDPNGANITPVTMGDGFITVALIVPTSTPSQTPTVTPTFTPTSTPTDTPTVTPTFTPTDTPPRRRRRRRRTRRPDADLHPDLHPDTAAAQARHPRVTQQEPSGPGR